jgi:hypothetical protein
MTKSVSARFSYYVMAFGLIVVAAVYGAMGAGAAKSAAVGVCVGLANWYVLRFIVGFLLSGVATQQLGAAALLFAKLGALIAGLFLLLRSGFVVLIPFTFGVSSLVVGVLAGALHQSLVTGSALTEPKES